LYLREIKNDYLTQVRKGHYCGHEAPCKHRFHLKKRSTSPEKTHAHHRGEGEIRGGWAHTSKPKGGKTEKTLSEMHAVVFADTEGESPLLLLRKKRGKTAWRLRPITDSVGGNFFGNFPLLEKKKGKKQEKGRVGMPGDRRMIFTSKKTVMLVLPIYSGERNREYGYGATRGAPTIFGEESNDSHSDT